MAQTEKILTRKALLKNLDSFQEFITDCARQYLLPEDRILKLQLASEEALMNIFSYAYPDDAPGDVTVRCFHQKAGELLISFEDSGEAFDVLCVDDPDTTLSLEDRDVGGLGIFFMKQMTDAVWYARKENKNILTFRLSLS
ncbi:MULTISPECIES: ATP-binding protein [Desulfotignum]|jgi:anti-sigma regulatory factor (Ser/Thr protein kinase)|uniref:Putative anti-sigma regulatory factor, serine/threonine protein kinase n=1 Tax=Desulfotignum phosphitoxidans DSM 13687 TaxID=1286635 RepID=S0G275_9BACT|nr:MULTISPECIES: ATP-binding protein [Desulfotignum]EMS81025.1 putative anti-sigma regulatory factor, serine/threonine protein kinase [Desulfotignum phosphitoxidans DSM 13687]